jgi:hypothetical protein
MLCEGADGDLAREVSEPSTPTTMRRRGSGSGWVVIAVSCVAEPQEPVGRAAARPAAVDRLRDRLPPDYRYLFA